MTLALIEGAVDALSTYLQANISAKVTELNSRYGDSVTLIDPIDWYIGAYPHSMPANPSVALVGMGWIPEEGGQRKANIDVLSRVDIAVFVGDNEIEARFRKLARYALGMVEMLKAGKGDMGYSRVMLAGEVALSEIMDTPDFLQAVLVPVAMALTEEY